MAKRKLLSGVMNYAEAALNQIQRLTQDQQQQRDNAVQKMERVEAYEQQITQAMTEKMVKQGVPVVSGKKR